ARRRERVCRPHVIDERFGGRGVLEAERLIALWAARRRRSCGVRGRVGLRCCGNRSGRCARERERRARAFQECTTAVRTGFRPVFIHDGFLPLRNRELRPAEPAASTFEGRTSAFERRVSSSAAMKSKSPSQLIDARIKELGDWRGTTLSRLRAL